MNSKWDSRRAAYSWIRLFVANPFILSAAANPSSRRSHLHPIYDGQVQGYTLSPRRRRKRSLTRRARHELYFFDVAYQPSPSDLLLQLPFAVKFAR